MDLKEAKEYIANFHKIVGQPTPITFVVYNSGRKINISDMDDNEIIRTALNMRDIEIQAGRPACASIN